jgi:hypothetical protein
VTTLALFADAVTAPDGSSDAQCTPRDLALELGMFGIDPCSNPRSHIRALRSYQLERGEDGLSLPWDLGDGIPCSAFVNGPYSNPLPWCERLRSHRAPWVALWKAEFTTEWFRQLIAGGAQWAPFRSRLRFEKPGNCGTADFCSVLFWKDVELSEAVQARLWMPQDQQTQRAIAASAELDVIGGSYVGSK